ncbi:MAG TPA: PH domain-containing protein [candidate division WWE3 bacterium]|uniref:PH domain-containing protein n=1 Tax=candidate division WWE3 bacterium TaxID=2053526 RepID=A0A7C1HYQ4_UNCKA|nr:PH domain-containing protein [candidate division WWE3 bacterium]
MIGLLSSFIKNPSKTRYDGEDTDEKILYLFRRSHIVNLKWIFITVFMLFTPFFASLFYGSPLNNGDLILSPELMGISTIFWYLATFGFVLHNFFIWYFNVYIVSSKKIVDIDFHGLLYKNISEAPIKNVEDVTSNVSGLMGTIFNYGYVYIQTSAEKREFEFEDVDNPAKVRDLIADFVERRKNGH